MAGKDDAEHVPDLALVPVSRRPDVGDGGHQRIAGRERYLEADIRVAGKRQQVVDHGEIACRLAFTVAAHALVNGGEVIQHAIGAPCFQFQVTQDVTYPVPFDPLGGHAVSGCLGGADRRTEAILQFLENIRNAGFQGNGG